MNRSCQLVQIILNNGVGPEHKSSNCDQSFETSCITRSVKELIHENLITDMKFLGGKMGMLTILILILMKGTDGLTWNTKMMAFVCCQGNDQFLIWNFTEGENERVTELHWYFNEKTVVCLVSTSTGFVVADLYNGRVERNGTAGILLKNASLNDTGEYTLYVKLEEEKEPNVQGINLTVVEPPPNQCKPIIKKEHPKGIISCSTSCERSPLSIEWIINGITDTRDIGPYFVVNSSGTSEQPICCLHDFKCLDDYQIKFCTRNNISFTEDIHTVNESVADTNHMVYTPILIILSVILMVLIIVVIVLNRRRCRLCFVVHKRHYATTARTDDIENELEEPLSGVPQPVQVTSHRDSSDSTSYRLMWDKPDDGGSPLIKYIIRYCEVEIIPDGTEYELSKYLKPFESVDNILPSVVSYKLSPLTPQRYYLVEIQAIYTQGLSLKSFIFKTKEGVPQPVQVTSHCDSPDSTSYRLMWDKPDDGGSLLIKYKIRYCEVEIIPDRTEYELSKYLKQFESVDNILPSAVSYELSPLTPGRYYLVEIQAIYTKGQTLKSFIFKTKEGVPQSVQVTSHRDSPDSTSYQLMWNRPDDGGCTLIKYIILYCQVEIIPDRTEYELSKYLKQFEFVDNILPSAVSYELSPLTPGRYYLVEIQAIYTKGQTLKSFIFKTKEGVPQSVQVTSHCDSPDSTSYRLLWNKPDDGGSTLIKYIIRYCEVEINPNGTEYELSKPLSQFVTVEISPSDVNYTLSSLKPGSYYQVEVQAVNTIGMSSKRFIFKTKEIAVEPTHSNTVVQFNEDLQQFCTVAATTDRPLQDSNQHVQIVNNISIDTDFLKSITHPNRALMTEIQAIRKETRKLKWQLHQGKYLRPRYSFEMTPGKGRYFKKNDTDTFKTSESEDASSDDTDTFKTSESEDASSEKSSPYMEAVQEPDADVKLDLIQETRKLKRQLHRDKHLRRKENRPKYSFDMTPVKCKYFKKTSTNELVPLEDIVSS